MHTSAAEDGSVPTVHRQVTLSAIGGEARGHVVRRGCFTEIGQMATHAFGGKSEAIELADRANFVAGVTVHGSVGADQRKPVLMLVDVVNGNLPAVRVVAKCALRTVLAAMQIGVAILTLFRSIAEDESLVAISALHFGMAPAQGKSCLRVVELEFGTQRRPTLRGVTILARDRKFIAVRAATVAKRDILRERNTPEKENENKYEKGPVVRQTTIPCDGFVMPTKWARLAGTNSILGSEFEIALAHVLPEATFCKFAHTMAFVELLCEIATSGRRDITRTFC